MAAQNKADNVIVRFRAEAAAAAFSFCDFCCFHDGPNVSPKAVFEHLLSRFAEANMSQHETWNMMLDISGTLFDVGADNPMPAYKILTRIGPRLLQPGGPWMRLQPIRDKPGAEILRWRFFSLALPPLLLIAAASPRESRPPISVRVLDPTLVPSTPVALLHVHMGALPSFEALWAELGDRLLLNPNLSLREETEPPLGITGKEWQRWRNLLRLGFMVRHVLDAHLGHPGKLNECNRCDLDGSWQGALVDFAKGTIPELTAAGFPAGPQPALAPEFLSDRLRSHVDRDRNYTDDEYGDLIACRIREEAWFLRRSFDYLDQDRKPSARCFESLFVQYIRLKCILYDLCVVADAGLKSFQSRLQRSRIYRTEKLVLHSLASTVDEVGLSVNSVEVRCTPDTWMKYCNTLPRPLDGTRANNRESGWVAHFTRKHPKEEALPWYRQEYLTHKEQARRLCDAIRMKADRLHSLRGLDLASVEGDQPLWVSLPHIAEVRSVSRDVASQCPERGLEPLRLTLHVGEDFSHIASGLRAVHEPFAWNLVDRGDRLGHALALGRDVLAWSEKHPTVEVLQWDRFLDLAWMRYCIWKFDLPIALPMLQRLDEQAAAIAEAIWDVKDPIPSLWECDPATGPTTTRLDYPAAGWIALGNSDLFAALGYPDRDDQPAYPVSILHDGHDGAHTSLPRRVSLEWLHRYLWSSSTHKRARERIPVVTLPDVHLLTAIQTKLQELVAQWQVAIEVNPTSNLLVAGFDHPLDQPMFQLRPIDPKQPECVPVVLSTDDPIAFATCLSDEFAYAWAGMVVASRRPASYARTWLEEAAATSMRMRFTVPLPWPELDIDE